jgi:hypothetical protein
MIKNIDIEIYRTNFILYSRNLYLRTKTKAQNLVINRLWNIIFKIWKDTLAGLSQLINDENSQNQ